MDVGVMVSVGALNTRPSARTHARVWVVLHLPGQRKRDRWGGEGDGGVINDLSGLFYRRERTDYGQSSLHLNDSRCRTVLDRSHTAACSHRADMTARSIRHVDDGPGLRDFVNHATHATVSVTD